ncbi:MULTISPECIES: hypothetical protein [Streptomyces]|uniref:Uncharacterized protein n=1 Tax=Streptomyces lonegramiae TaxID=3075524 RepID=A0ABU2XAY3_9ACTN|nr:hypothetical protein [Streptomyces sp. DSM 41529]MDT0543080.1 hypothetical protein [Streptomyces sp. DSM 41529]
MPRTGESTRRQRNSERKYSRYAKKGLGIAFGATISSLVKLGWEHVRREYGL